MEKYECFRFRIGAVNGPATELCRLVVRGAVLVLLVANVLAIPTAIAARSKVVYGRNSFRRAVDILYYLVQLKKINHFVV